MLVVDVGTVEERGALILHGLEQGYTTLQRDGDLNTYLSLPLHDERVLVPDDVAQWLASKGYFSKPVLCG